MNQPIRNDHIFLGQNGFKNTGIGIHTGWEKNRIFSSQKFCHLLFQLPVDILSPADKPYRRQTKAAPVEPFMGSFDDLRMVGQPEIIIGAHIDNFF